MDGAIIGESIPLRDIHLPESVSTWPPATGWWLLAIVSIIVIIITTVLALRFIKRYRDKWGYRKAALPLIDHHYQLWKKNHAQQTPDYTQETIHQLLRVLKRVAISAYPQQDISGLHSQAWVDFLNQQTSPKLFFNQKLADTLISLQYQSSKKANAFDDVEALYVACRQWIKHHKVSIEPANPVHKEAVD